MTEKIDIKNLEHAEYTQVTGAGQVIEIIRAEILYHHEMSLSASPATSKRHCNKRHGLEMLLDAITLSELKMQAWQELHGKKPITGDLYKQLANQDLFNHDKAVKAQGLEAVDKGDYLEVDLDEELALCDWDLDKD